MIESLAASADHPSASLSIWLVRRRECIATRAFLGRTGDFAEITLRCQPGLVCEFEDIDLGPTEIVGHHRFESLHDALRALMQLDQALHTKFDRVRERLFFVSPEVANDELMKLFKVGFKRPRGRPRLHRGRGLISTTPFMAPLEISRRVRDAAKRLSGNNVARRTDNLPICIAYTCIPTYLGEPTECGIVSLAALAYLFEAFLKEAPREPDEAILFHSIDVHLQIVEACLDRRPKVVAQFLGPDGVVDHRDYFLSRLSPKEELMMLKDALEKFPSLAEPLIANLSVHARRILDAAAPVSWPRRSDGIVATDSIPPTEILAALRDALYSTACNSRPDEPLLKAATEAISNACDALGLAGKGAGYRDPETGRLWGVRHRLAQRIGCRFGLRLVTEKNGHRLHRPRVPTP